MDKYNGYSIETETGTYTIAARDNGIEVVRDGEIVWASLGAGLDQSVDGSGEIERLAAYILGLDAGVPRVDEQHPNGMSAVDSAIVLTDRLRGALEEIRQWKGEVSAKGLAVFDRRLQETHDIDPASLAGKV